MGCRIEDFMATKLNIPADQVHALREYYFNHYGTTLRGLEVEYGIEPREYLSFVHDLPLDQFIHRDEHVKSAFHNLPFPKVILTNSDHSHADRVLDILGLQEYFSKIIDVLDLSPYCKPAPQSFLKALDLLGNPNPENCVLFEDSPRNIQAAREIGMVTVQVGKPEVNSISHYKIGAIGDLTSLFDSDFDLIAESTL